MRSPDLGGSNGPSPRNAFCLGVVVTRNPVMAGRNGKREFGSRSSAYDVVAGHDLSGRTIVVTGASTGIGEATARVLVSAGARVVFGCRERATGEAAVARARAVHPGCRAECAELDLASFESVRR